MPFGLLAHLLALLGLGGEGVIGGELLRGHVVPVVGEIIDPQGSGVNTRNAADASRSGSDAHQCRQR
jgi:hypothetical protein